MSHCGENGADTYYARNILDALCILCGSSLGINK
jgi:hypothetical protein